MPQELVPEADPQVRSFDEAGDIREDGRLEVLRAGRGADGGEGKGAA